jgi:hypothetical protein
MEKMMEMDDELRALKREQERSTSWSRTSSAISGNGTCATRSFGRSCVVQAQNDFADAMDQVASYGVDERVVEAAIKERRIAIAALQEALEDEPRWTTC